MPISLMDTSILYIRDGRNSGPQTSIEQFFQLLCSRIRNQANIEENNNNQQKFSNDFQRHSQNDDENEQQINQISLITDEPLFPSDCISS